MPNIDPPAQTHVNGTRNRANQLRVVAPAVNPSPAGSYQAPAGGEFRSTGPEGGANEDRSEDKIGLPLLKTSDSRNVLPHARQSATSVPTLISEVAISARHLGQLTFIDFGELCHTHCPAPVRIG